MLGSANAASVSAPDAAVATPRLVYAGCTQYPISRPPAPILAISPAVLAPLNIVPRVIKPVGLGCPGHPRPQVRQRLADQPEAQLRVRCSPAAQIDGRVAEVIRRRVHAPDHRGHRTGRANGIRRLVAYQPADRS